MEQPQPKGHTSANVHAIGLADELSVLVVTAIAFGILGVLFVALVQFSAPAQAQQQLTAVPCEKILMDESQAGFASPIDLFGSTRSVILGVTCGDRFAQVRAGGGSLPRFIYRYGYAWRNGAWERFEFTGEKVGEVWIKDQALATLPRTNQELSQTSHVIAYICTLDTGVWKCGCSDQACRSASWSLQSYARAQETPIARSATTNEFTGAVRKADGTPDYDAMVAPEIGVFYPSSYIGTHGTSLTLSGYGFALHNNTVIFRTIDGRDYEVPGLPSEGGNSITVRVPDGIPYGVYSVIVRHEGGRSFNSAMFTLVRPGAQFPIITSVSPSQGRIGTTVTLTGRNFAREGNIIYTGYGQVLNVPSPDGTTLTFEFTPFPEFPELTQIDPSRGPLRMEFRLLVANENGVTREYDTFHLVY